MAEYTLWGDTGCVALAERHPSEARGGGQSEDVKFIVILPETHGAGIVFCGLTERTGHHIL